MRAPLTLALVLALTTACSSSTSDPGGAPTDGASDSATGDSPIDGVSDGPTGCVSPTEGAACTSTDVLCKGFEGGCCAGYLWTCTGSTWKRSGLGCPCMPADSGVDARDASDTKVEDSGPFACGTSLTCAPDKYCHDQAPGIPGPDGGTLPDSYSCDSIPDACKATPTCDCVKTKVPGCTGTCTTDAAGHVTMHCMGA